MRSFLQHTFLLAASLLAACTGAGNQSGATTNAVPGIDLATSTQHTMTPMQPSPSAAQAANVPLMDLEAKVAYQTATFALGWFWGPDARFGSLEGVLRTRVGYCGGSTKNPTYRSIGDHAETIQIDFDPTRIGYEQLLELFWTTHNPCRSAWSRQYMSAVFYHDEAQREAIEATRKQFVKTPDDIQTEIAPLDTFWIAEDYHQKYRLRHEGAIDDELHAIYPDEADYVNSTAAARLNGYLDGYGDEQQLEREIRKLGLSETAQALLRKRAL